MREITSIDPDMIFTEHGNSSDLPYLYHRAALHDVDLQLGREKDIMPGQCVRYIITDHSAKYCEYLLHAAEGILLPFGTRRSGWMKS